MLARYSGVHFRCARLPKNSGNSEISSERLSKAGYPALGCNNGKKPDFSRWLVAGRLDLIGQQCNQLADFIVVRVHATFKCSDMLLE
jgi:hypothetical protein